MQLDYSHSPAKGFPGMLADSGPRQVTSKVNPAVAIPFGTAVAKGTDDDHVKLPTTAAEVTASIGIAIQDPVTEQDSSFTLATYAINSSVNVLRKGRAWVTVEEAVTSGDTPYVRWANGNGGKTQKGAFRKSVDQVSSADTATILPNAKYITSASAGELAIVEINTP